MKRIAIVLMVLILYCPAYAGFVNGDVALNSAARHTQGTDTELGTLGTKTTPVDADKVIARDSAATDAIKTSTWTQVKAFLKTYFDTLYTGASPTNLSEGTTTNTTVDVDSSDGSNATLASASASRAGLLTKAKFDEIVANSAHTAVTDPANKIIISATGGDFTTIQAALNNAGSPLANTMFVVYPGTYTDDTINFTANNQWVVGAQNVAPKTVLVTNSTTICNYGTFMGCVVKDIKMVMTLLTTVADSTIDGGIPSTPGSSSVNFKHCHIECIAPAGAIGGTVAGGSTAIRGAGIVKVVDGSIVYTNDATRTGRGKKAILIEDDTFLTLDKVTVTVTASGVSTATAVVRDNSDDGGMLIQNCTVDITDDDADITYGLNIDEGHGTPEVYRNNVHVTNDGADKTAIVIRVGSSSTLSVRSRYNHFHAVAGGTGTTYAYCLQIDDANTTVISQFDDLVCKDGVNIIAGTYTYVNSPDDGDLNMTGNIDAATYGSDGTLTDAELLYINSLSSNAQDQIDAKIAKSEFTANSEILVGTGVGTFQKESGATLRTSIDVDQAGTDNSTDVTLDASATTGGLSITGQVISNQAADTTNSGYLSTADWDTFNDKATAPTVYAKTSSATLTATEISGFNTLDNDGAGAEVVLTWPALSTGQEAVFYVNDAQYLQIKAPAATTIRIGAVSSAAEGYVRSNVVGNWIRIKAMPDGLVVMGYGGNWTYDE